MGSGALFCTATGYTPGYVIILCKLLMKNQNTCKKHGDGVFLPHTGEVIRTKGLV